MNTTIQAAIHDSCIERVTRFYDATPPTIFRELFQNACRSGASRIDITSVPGPEQADVTVLDNGSGVSDPRLLLSYGENGWDPETVRDEDAAGMGMLCLASIGCTVTSFRDNDAWTVTLEPEHFAGRMPATVHPADREALPPGSGTRVAFPLREPLHNFFPETAKGFRCSAEQAARYLPIEVTFRTDPSAKPETLARNQFCDDENYAPILQDGIRFGVTRPGIEHASFQHENDPDLNLLGITARAMLPHVTDAAGHTWGARADLAELGGIRLTLPARSAIIESEAVEQLRRSARMAILNAIAASPDPRPKFRDWEFARDNGIDMPQPSPRLCPWQPASADPNATHDPMAPIVPPEKSLLVSPDIDTVGQHNLARAFDTAEKRLTLLESNIGYEGYPWYDRLPLIEGEVVVKHAMRSGETLATTGFNAPRNPRFLRIACTIIHPGGKHVTRYVPTDFAIVHDSDSGYEPCIHDVMMYATPHCQLKPDTAMDIVHPALFCPNYECDSDSYETQVQEFHDSAFTHLGKLSHDSETAAKETLRRALDRHVRFLLPRSFQATITLSQQKGIDISLERIPDKC